MIQSRIAQRTNRFQQRFITSAFVQFLSLPTQRQTKEIQWSLPLRKHFLNLSPLSPYLSFSVSLSSHFYVIVIFYFHYAFILCVCTFCLPACMFTRTVPSGSGGQKTASNLKLAGGGFCHLGTENPAQVLWKSSQYSYPLSHLSSSSVNNS